MRRVFKKEFSQALSRIGNVGESSQRIEEVKYHICTEVIRRDCFNLTELEELAYRRCIDLVFELGGSIPSQVSWLSAKIGLPVEIVEQMLNTCFVPEEFGWTIPWAKEQIEKKCAKKEHTFSASHVCARAPAFEVRRLHDHDVRQEHTHDHEEEKKEKENAANAAQKKKKECRVCGSEKVSRVGGICEDCKVRTTVQQPDGVKDQTWRDFNKHRNALRAPLTETAIRRIAEEAQLAGWKLDDALAECTARGWRSFKAEWVGKKNTPSINNTEYGETGAL